MEAVGRVFGSQGRYERGAAARAAGPRADRDGCAPRLVGDARPPGGARADLPGLVARAPAAVRRRRRAGAVSGGREAVLARVRAALAPARRVAGVPRAYRSGRAGRRRRCRSQSTFLRARRRVSGDREPSARRRAAGRAVAACEEREARRSRCPRGPSRTVGARVGARTTSALASPARRARRRAVGLRPRDRRHGHDRARRRRGASGRRALTLVPDHHVCIVSAKHIVPSVPDGVAALARVAAEGRPITFVSGPSATVGHRARPRRGRPRPAHARRVRRRFHHVNNSSADEVSRVGWDWG